MSKLSHSILLMVLVLVNTACRHKKDDPTPEPITTRTVLVYMAADNSLGQLDLASDDIEELRKGVLSTNSKTDNLLYYIDNYSGNPRLVKLDINGTTYQETTVKTYPEHNSVSVNTMSQVIADVKAAYPATSYGLVLWSHADGWVPSAKATVASSTTRWWGEDAGFYSYMDIPDLKTVLSSAPRFSFILFDACFMSSAEVIYELRDYCDYLIACPAEIPGPGAYYPDVVPAMFNYMDTEANNVGLSIASAYYTHYANSYNPAIPNSNNNWTAGVCIEAVKTKNIDMLASATNNIITAHIHDSEAIDASGIYNYDNRQAKRYYHDMKEFIQHIANAKEYAEWKSAFDKAVIYWAATPKIYTAAKSDVVEVDNNAGGLSVYLPNSGQPSLNTYLKKLEWYRAAGWNSTGW
ncbi:clostripain-related cysteine peptidase [Phocaeicola oris]|uniref:clostripain-related cysteine peptidase n=1 Tax=Phocaeicola oris TaxID=2896850 RepID=UPI00234E7B72|nr:clostripain-related cysteine peptidase [Phocaeicola oris]MCE2616857.1 clostripain-related cysteine peptidase [Phocaeicola oris]